MYSLQTWAFPDWPAMAFLLFVASLFSLLGLMLSSGFRDSHTFNLVDAIAGFIVFCVVFLSAFHISYSSTINLYNDRVTQARQEIAAMEKRYAKVVQVCKSETYFTEKTDYKYLVKVYECEPYQDTLNLQLAGLHQDLVYLKANHAYRN